MTTNGLEDSAWNLNIFEKIELVELKIGNKPLKYMNLLQITAMAKSMTFKMSELDQNWKVKLKAALNNI